MPATSPCWCGHEPIAHAIQRLASPAGMLLIPWCLRCATERLVFDAHSYVAESVELVEVLA